MILAGRSRENVVNESSQYMTYSDLIEGPYDSDELEANRSRLNSVAKILKCSSKDLAIVTEESSLYNKIVKIVNNLGEKGTSVKVSNLDGYSNLHKLGDCNVVVTNEWGYISIYMKKSDVRTITSM